MSNYIPIEEENHLKDKLVKLENDRSFYISEILIWEKIYPFVQRKMIMRYLNKIIEYKFDFEDLSNDLDCDPGIQQYYFKILAKIERCNLIHETIWELYKETKGIKINDYIEHLMRIRDDNKMTTFRILAIKRWMLNQIIMENTIEGYETESFDECRVARIYGKDNKALY